MRLPSQDVPASVDCVTILQWEDLICETESGGDLRKTGTRVLGQGGAAHWWRHLPDLLLNAPL